MPKALKVREVKHVAVQQPQSVASFSPENLIAQAIDKGVPVETMERLLLMRRELRAEQAKEAFDDALSNFQADCPIIKKKKKVMNKDKESVRYAFAPLDDIVDQVKPLLKIHGFSYSINTPPDTEWVTAVVTITHKQGHSKDSEFKIPVDKESFMTAQQKYASALTFAKRYAFCNAFGILTGDDDDDAQQNPKEKGNKTLFEIAKSMIEKAGIEQLEEYKDKVVTSKKYSDPEKAELVALANKRINELVDSQ